MQQLDIFADSRDVMLRNDVLERLQQRDATPARAALMRLTDEYPDDEASPALAALVRALEAGSAAPLVDHEAFAQTHRVLANEVVPAAQRVLSRQTVQAWLAPLWRSLARRAAGLAFRAAAEDCHAAPVWLRAGDWESARASVEGIESWWRIPAPLAWMTDARYRSEGLDAAWPLLAELAWLAPVRFAALLSGLGDASLDALRRRFDAGFAGTGDVEDFMWFPALRARGKQWTPVGALKILGSAVCEVSIRLAEKVDRTTVGVSIFRRKFRMVGSPIRQGFRLC
ncbi:hypothetical protein ACFSHT_28835 [Paraburkholderia silviterrae]|uniref:hypothetical protein n=1 Tax=Paraburkholderia silviterrae TaxID=2528715 RepID=UPI00196B3714|nr:hypothetical protein [Paraburkholderia silviterrae]